MPRREAKMEIGQVCVKIAGRDAGKKCIVVDILDAQYVLIDGQTRRRKCNVKHVEPLPQLAKIKKNASRAEVVKELKRLNIEVTETKPKKSGERPRRIRGKQKAAREAAKPAKEKKVEEKKAEEKKAAKAEMAQEKKEGKTEVTQSKKQEKTTAKKAHPKKK